MTASLAEPLPGLALRGPPIAGQEHVLTPDALAFLARLERGFGARRRALLAMRNERQARLDAGERLDFDSDTAEMRAADWRVPPAPADLADRRVEITGPVDRKMIINALNAGAQGFMADFEDATSPTWANLIEGQRNLMDAVARTIAFDDPASGKRYALTDRPATLHVRPRGWHLEEAHLEIDGSPMSGGLFDFGLYLHHNHRGLKALGSGPYFYLPKLETGAEAQLWADVFAFAESALGLPRGTIRATVLIETLPATFALDEILYALKDWATGLNCGRWDYIFSFIKRCRTRSDLVLPERSQVTMAAPFMSAYARLVIETGHRRGAHAMGGMSAFIPVKGDDAKNAAALAQVRADKTREASLGHDGAWVAHPALVPIARQAFDAAMPGPNQLDKRTGFRATPAELIARPQGTITEAGIRANVSVAIQYLASWLRGQGAAPIHNLMEDTATAEIARAQLWQWRVHGATTADGARIDARYLETIFADERATLGAQRGADAHGEAQSAQAEELISALVFDDAFAEFLTLPAYRRLIAAP